MGIAMYYQIVCVSSQDNLVLVFEIRGNCDEGYSK